MSAIAPTLEHELSQLTDRIRELDADASVRQDAAEQLVADLREEGRNPLVESDAFEQVDAAYKSADEVREQAAELRRRAEAVMERLGRAAPAAVQERPRRRGPAHALMASPEYQRLAEVGAFHSAGAHIELPGVEVMSRDDLVEAMRTGRPLMHATIDGSSFVPPDMRLFPPVEIPVRALRILDLVTKATTESDSVKYVVETARTDVAAPTALGTAYNEATYTYEEREATVRDIGHFVPAHRSNLADAGQLQGLIEGRLGAGVERALETQIISGDGTGQNLTGILETDGIGAVDRDSTASERLIEVIHRGITTVRVALEAEPDAIAMHPADYEDAIFEKDVTSGQYLLGPAAQLTSRTIWGLPVTLSTGLTEKTVVVGNFAVGAVLWNRSGVAVRASDSHSDFFTRRMVAILAELRAAFAAWQPRAFCEVDLS